MWRFKENEEDTYAWLRLALHFSHQEYQKKNTRGILGEAKIE
jgi:hypothetical protein